jgi:hypothetical protein
MDCQRPRFLPKMENFGFATKIIPRVVNSFALIKTARCSKRLCQCGERMDRFIRCVIQALKRAVLGEKII